MAKKTKVDATELGGVKKGDSVIMKGFTGMKLGVFQVVEATEKTITIKKKDGLKVKFSRKTGKQMNIDEGKERFANSIIVDDGSYVAPVRKKKEDKKVDKKKKATKPVKQEEPVEEDEDEDDEDEDYEEV